MTLQNPLLTPHCELTTAPARPWSPAPSLRTRLAAAHLGPVIGLRRCLFFLDALGVTLAWAVALLAMEPAAGPARSGSPIAVALIVAAALAMLASQHLYRARVCSVRAVETERLIRTSVLTAVLVFVVGGLGGSMITVHDAAVGGGAMFLLLRGLRSAFGGYLQAGRRRGRFSRPVVLVGANDEAHDLYRLLRQHPELGYGIVGFVGETSGSGPGFDVPWLGTVEETEDAVSRSGATGVIVAATALETAALNRLIRTLTEKSLHVHLSSGIRGIAQNRLRAQPMAHEPLFYVEPLRQSGWQLATKRGLDIALAGIGLILSLPVLALAAVAIKLDDRGPVLFRQTRVGRDGRHFTILKLRTMATDSEGRYQELAATQAGRSGPLVKLRDDPRITRVGHFLRSSSVDELPQLLNVLAGTMSMVGPRPNLLVEAEGLDRAFVDQKNRMRPGITGLWQVEARDNPSFEVYRRLDLFYLENWSPTLDGTILLATVRRVLGRSVRLLLPGRILHRMGLVGSAGLQ